MGLPLFSAQRRSRAVFLPLRRAVGLSSCRPRVATRVAPRHHRHRGALQRRRRDGGDRQATGNYIASRDVRKIEAADRFTALAISGTAARGMEFIRMAQLSFEHYEKMTDVALSLEGKANYLSPIIQRNNLSTPRSSSCHCWRDGTPATRSGASSSTTARADATSASTSPPSARALPSPRAHCASAFSADLDLEAALDLGALALYEAGDNDPSTGGPDFVRNIFPMMVTITERGLPGTRRATRSRERFGAINERRTRSGGVAGGTLR